MSGVCQLIAPPNTDEWKQWDAWNCDSNTFTIYYHLDEELTQLTGMAV